MDNEIGGRYMSVVEGHSGPPWQYLLVLHQYGLGPWNYLLIPAIVAAFFVGDEQQKRIALMCGIVCVSLLVLLSASSTKIHWYLLPAYPLLTILVALFLWWICRLLLQLKQPEPFRNLYLLPLLLLALLAYRPYKSVLHVVLRTSVSGNDEDAKLYIKQAMAGKRPMLANAYSGDTYGMIWYDAVLRMKGVPFRHIHWDSLSAGMKVMVWQKDVKENITKHYHAKPIDGLGDAQVFVIDSVVR
jgi:hypothetical protein